jgi:hypothetical protein
MITVGGCVSFSPYAALYQLCADILRNFVRLVLANAVD